MSTTNAISAHKLLLVKDGSPVQITAKLMGPVTLSQSSRPHRDVVRINGTEGGGCTVPQVAWRMGQLKNNLERYGVHPVKPCPTDSAIPSALTRPFHWPRSVTLCAVRHACTYFGVWETNVRTCTALSVPDPGPTEVNISWPREASAREWVGRQQGR